MNRIELEPVDRVEITLLIDNVTDPLLVDQEAIARMNWPKRFSEDCRARRRGARALPPPARVRQA